MHNEGHHPHTAGFDMKIWGATTRTLLDSRVNVSVTSKQFPQRLGSTWQPGNSTDSVGGFGVHKKTYGSTQVTVNMGKEHPAHVFQVLPNAQSDHHCILGEGFLHPWGVSLEYHEPVIKAKLHLGRPAEHVALQRKAPAPTTQPQVNALNNQDQETPEKGPKIMEGV